MSVEILNGNSADVVKTLPDESIDCVVTSPPYFGLRDYGVDGQFGLEKTPNEYVSVMVNLFREIRRVLKDAGTIWINIGDSYFNTLHGGFHEQGKTSIVKNDRFKGSQITQEPFGLKRKNLIGIPWKLAFALQEDGWYLRQDIIWYRPNSMPESVKDRCAKAHEYIFLLSKKEKYYFDLDAIKEDCESPVQSRTKNNGESAVDTKIRGSNGGCGTQDKRTKRSVWVVPTKGFAGAHFAPYPKALITPCILAGCPEGGTVLDPFFGTGTTGCVCNELGRNCIGIELNPEYIEIAKTRLAGFEKREELISAKIDYDDLDI